MAASLPLTLRELGRAELKDAARLLGRSMRDNPANVRAFAIQDGQRRCRALERFFVPVLHGLYRRGLILGAFRDVALVGVCGRARPTLCQPSLLGPLSGGRSMLFGDPAGTPLRGLRWPREGAWRGAI